MTGYRNPNVAEVEHDEKMLDLLRDQYQASGRFMFAAQRVREFAGEYRQDVAKVNYGRTRTVAWKADGRRLDIRDAIDLLADLGDPVKLAEVAAYYRDQPQVAGYYSQPERIAERAARYVAEFEEAKAVAEAAEAAVIEHDKGYKGWARFFLVVTSAGHVHRNMECSTCRPTTGYAILPGLSGATDEQAVALVGPNLCSVCFPLAPVDMVGGKLTEALVKVLVEEGEDAFRAKLTKAMAACPGSGTWDYDRDTARLGYYAGNGATCNHCGQRVGVTATNKLRKHLPKKEA